MSDLRRNSEFSRHNSQKMNLYVGLTLQRVSDLMEIRELTVHVTRTSEFKKKRSHCACHSSSSNEKCKVLQIYIYDTSLYLLSQRCVYFDTSHSLSSQHVSAPLGHHQVNHKHFFIF
jgi:hypothetical protein